LASFYQKQFNLKKDHGFIIIISLQLKGKKGSRKELARFGGMKAREKRATLQSARYIFHFPWQIIVYRQLQGTTLKRCFGLFLFSSESSDGQKSYQKIYKTTPRLAP